MNTSSKTRPAWHQYRHQLNAIEANVDGNIHFAHYFALMGKCRDHALQAMLPNAEAYRKKGFSLITESAHIDFAREGKSPDQVLVQMGCRSLSRTRMEFEFEFIHEQDGTLLGKGRNANIWVNPQRHPAVMPEELYNNTALRAALNDRETSLE